MIHMAQGIIGGATSYGGQSINDIKKDIVDWMRYTEEIMSEIELGIETLKQSGFWSKVSFNFQMTLFSSLTCQRTFIEDMTAIVSRIDEDSVTEKEVKLLYKIGKNAIEFNYEYGQTYKNSDRWHDYGNPDFRVAEKLYQNGRDYFVTLQDATNASSRLSDYITIVPPVVNNHVTQNISGNENVITGVNTGNISIIKNDIEAFKNEVISAKSKIGGLENVDKEIKEYVCELLENAESALEKDDTEKIESCRADYRGFIIGSGVKAFKVIGALSSFASIASFFGITM